MASILESQLSLFEREAEMAADPSVPDRASSLEDTISLYTALFDVLERRLGVDGVTEAHRPLVPLFQRWLAVARRFANSARAARDQGQAVSGMDALARAMNRAKQVAEGFDYFVKLNEQTSRGETEKHTPLNEVLNGLRSRA